MARSYDDTDEEEDDDDEDDDEVDEPEGDDEVDDEEPEEVAVVVRKKRKAKGKKKDPSMPKRNMSAFFLYSQANRSQVKEDNPGSAFGDIAKLLSVQFKALPEKERKKWEKRAEKDKLRYQEEMKGYSPPDDDSDEDIRTTKKKKKKDPNAPKRNMSAYFLFSNYIRASTKEENPSATFGGIAQLISAKFKALPEKERKKWELKAEEDKARYQREMERYKS